MSVPPLLNPLVDDGARIVEPLVVIDLDEGAAPDDVAELGAEGRVVVGTSSDPLRSIALDRCDVVLSTTEAGPATVLAPDPAAEAQRLRAAAEADPQATVVLAGLLRATSSLPIDDAIDLESLAYSTLLGGPEFRRWLTARGPRRPPPHALEPVLADRDDGILRLTLNRPERRNAFGSEMRDALVEGLRLALLDPTVAELHLDGAGPAFCAGGDLDEFGTTPDLVTAHMVRTRCGAGRLLSRLAARTTVRVHGPCVGAGVELPAFAARVEADPASTFRLPELAMGLVPGAGGTVSLPRRIGRHRTLHLALSGASIDATTAYRWGLVDALS